MKKAIFITAFIVAVSSSAYAQFTGTNPVTLQASGANAYLRLGISTDYSWIQSYGPRPLRINEAGNDVLFNAGGGNIGIGTLSPDAKLSLFGAQGALFSMSATGANAYLKMGLNTDYAWIQSYGPRPLRINDIGNDVIFNVNGGSVGIGTTLPTNPGGFKLAVKGKIVAQEVQVETMTWADYVFQPDYKLMPLSKVENFVRLNKHLPEIPSEKEVLADGQKLGEMNVLLLKKVEELTLYLIEQNKRIEALESRLQECGN